MKKCYKLTIDCDDEDVDSISEALEGIKDEDVWLDTGEKTILLPPELADILEKTGILGIT